MRKGLFAWIFAPALFGNGRIVSHSCIFATQNGPTGFCLLRSTKFNITGGRMTTPQATTNDRREIFGWAMYDWANSAFSTTVGTVFLGPYIASLAADAAGADGLARSGTEWTEASGQPLVINFLGLPVAPRSEE